MTGVSHQSSSADLEARFSRLLARVGVTADDVYAVLASHYEAPGRHYHNFEHVRRCLAQMDAVRDRLRDPDAVELALWFHDAVNDPGAGDNKLRSALLFDARLGIHLPTGRAGSVHAMIMATLHPSSAADNDARFAADIDLSVLALPRQALRTALEALERERGGMAASGGEFSPPCFERLLRQSSIYLTEPFRARCEDQARRNLESLVTGPL